MSPGDSAAGDLKEHEYCESARMRPRSLQLEEIGNVGCVVWSV